MESWKRSTQHGYEKVGRLDLKGNKLGKDQRADCVRSSSGLSEGETKGLKRTEKWLSASGNFWYRERDERQNGKGMKGMRMKGLSRSFGSNHHISDGVGGGGFTDQSVFKIAWFPLGVVGVSTT